MLRFAEHGKGSERLNHVTALKGKRFAGIQRKLKFDQEPESKRERYLTPSEQSKLMEVLVDDLAFLRAPIEVSLGTGVRKHTELLKLKIANVNFSGLSVCKCPALRTTDEYRFPVFALVEILSASYHPETRVVAPRCTP